MKFYCILICWNWYVWYWDWQLHLRVCSHMISLMINGLVWRLLKWRRMSMKCLLNFSLNHLEFLCGIDFFCMLYCQESLAVVLGILIDISAPMRKYLVFISIFSYDAIKCREFILYRIYLLLLMSEQYIVQKFRAHSVLFTVNDTILPRYTSNKVFAK